MHCVYLDETRHLEYPGHTEVVSFLLLNMGDGWVSDEDVMNHTTF